MDNLILELRRRKVFRVVGSYAVVAWLLIQIVVSVEEPLQLPDWTDTFVIVSLLVGFPVCAALAWVFDISGGDIRRTGSPSAVENGKTSLTAGDKLIMTLSALAVVFTLGTSAYFVVGGWGGSAQKVAILPFITTEADDQFQYLGDGIRDNLITRLSRLRGVQIRSIDSVPPDLQSVELGALVDADILCSARLEYRGETIGITVELIEARSGAIVWRERFSSESSSLLEMEALIASSIVERMGVDLDESERTELARASTSNPAAHRLYLQGRYYWNRRTSEGLEASIDYYNDALALDPGFAQAYAGLAQTYLMRLGWGFGDPQSNARQIINTARTAIRLDPSLAEPFAALGYFKTIYERDWEGARSDFLQAIENNSSYSSAHHWYAFLLLTLGESRAAVEEILLAREIEPLSPIINAEVGYFYLFDRQYTRAQQELESVRVLDPNFPSTVSYLTRAYALNGQRDEAMALLDRWRIIVAEDSFFRAYGALVLPLLGRQEEAQAIYADTVELSRSDYVMPGLLGVLAASLGDFDQAAEHFAEGLATRTLILSWLRDPLLAGYHETAAYAALMGSVGLEL